MLERARERAAPLERRAASQFVEGDVMAMPFDDDAFDGATMGFSLRNVVDVDAHAYARFAACFAPARDS